MLELLKKLAPTLVLVAVFAFGVHIGSSKKDAEWKQEVSNEYVKKTEAREATQTEVSEISSKYQEDYAALEGSTDRVINDLRGSNKWLRAQVCDPGSTRDGNGRCESTVSVELHETTVRSLVKITESADLKEKALQDTIRKLTNKEK